MPKPKNIKKYLNPKYVSYPPAVDSPLNAKLTDDPMFRPMPSELHRAIIASSMDSTPKGGTLEAYRKSVDIFEQRSIEKAAADEILNAYGEGMVPSTAAKKASEKYTNKQLWQKYRDDEESVWEGERSHSILKTTGTGNNVVSKLITTPSGTLGVMRKRVKVWEAIDPSSIPMRSMIDELGMSLTSAKYLSSGRAGGKLWEPLRKILAYKLAEKESESANFSRNLGPESSYIGSLENDSVMSMEMDRQKSFLSNIFGADKAYRLSGTGKLLTNEQISRLKVGIPDSASYKISEGSKLEDFFKSTELRMKELRELAVVEARERWEQRNKVQKFGAGEEREENINEFQTKQQLNITNYGDEEHRVEAGFHEQYDPEKNLYWNRYRELRSLRNRAFRSKGGKVIWMSPEIKKKFMGEFKKMSTSKVNLSGMTRGGMELALGAETDKGRNLYYSARGVGRQDVEVSPLESFKEMYVKKLGSGEEVPLWDLVGRHAVPARAEAEQIFDIYFKKIDHRKYEAYTASGTYLGESPRNARNAVGKIFKWEKGGKDYFGVGWAENRSAFEWNRYGEVERATLKNMREEAESNAEAAGQSPVEIDSLKKINKKYQLWYSNKQDWLDSQKRLERMYHQVDASDYSLIGKYRKVSGGGKFMDVNTGEYVDQDAYEKYITSIRESYNGPEAVPHIPLAHGRGPKSGKIGEALSGLSKSFPKNKTWILAALGISGALVATSSIASNKGIDSQQDTGRQNYGSSTSDQMMFAGTNRPQPVARIVPEYQGRQGYTTSIDIHGTDNNGVDPNHLAYVMDRHARSAMGTRSAGTNVEINDNSGRSDQYALQQKYANMMGS